MVDAETSDAAAAAMKDILAGTVAGFAQVAAGHPLDNIKTRMITRSSRYPGMGDAFRKILAEEGVKGLYAGASSPLMGAMAINAMVFFSYGGARTFVGGGKELTVPQYGLAGNMAAVPITLIESPVELVKIKLMSQIGGGEYTGAIDCCKKLTAAHGVRVVYQGLAATLVRNVPGFGTYFAVFEGTKMALTKSGEEPSLPVCFVSGSAAGAGYWGLFYPLDTIKTRIQNDHVDPAKRVYSGVWDCFRKTSAEGTKALYKGFAPCITRAIPVNGAVFMGFTAAQRALS